MADKLLTEDADFILFENDSGDLLLEDNASAFSGATTLGIWIGKRRPQKKWAKWK